jgi:hypothetical protein
VLDESKTPDVLEISFAQLGVRSACYRIIDSRLGARGAAGHRLRRCAVCTRHALLLVVIIAQCTLTLINQAAERLNRQAR